MCLAVHLNEAGCGGGAETVPQSIHLPKQQQTLKPTRLGRDLEQTGHILLRQRHESLRYPGLVLLLSLRNVTLRLGPLPRDLPRNVRHIPLLSSVCIDRIHDLLQVPRRPPRVQIKPRKRRSQSQCSEERSQQRIRPDFEWHFFQAARERQAVANQTVGNF